MLGCKMPKTPLHDIKQLIWFFKTVSLFAVTSTVCKSIIFLKMLYSVLETLI